MPLDDADFKLCFADEADLGVHEFQRVMYGPLAEGEYLMQTAFLADPADAGNREWTGWAVEELQEFPDRNSYITPTVFQGDVEVKDFKTGKKVRKRRRRYDLMVRMPFFILDDERIDNATCVIQTSKDSYQSMFKLDQPITDANIARRLSDALQRRGKAGKNDPSGNNGVRWGRAPVGTNTKKKYGKPFCHKTIVWSPKQMWSLEQLDNLLNLDLNAALSKCETDDGWTLGAVPNYLKQKFHVSNDDLSAGLVVLQNNHPPSDAYKIADRCQTVGHMRNNKGEDQNEQLWLAVLQVLVRTVQSDEVCHDWSSGHPGYQLSDCQAKIDHAKKDMRPVTCEFMRSVSPHCAGCQQTCNSPIRLGEPDRPSKQFGFRLTPVGELLSPPKPLEWLIKGILLPESQGLLFGDSGTAKSFLAIDVTCCIGVGREWHGHKVKQGAVVYIAGEGHFGIRRRMLAWAIENDCIEQINRAPIVVSSTGAQFTDSDNFNEVLDAIEAVESSYGPIAIIVIDTLHRNLGGDENSADDISIYYRHADKLRDQFNSTVLTIHHSGHSEKGRSRGSSAIRAATDCEFLMENTKVGMRRLSSTKVKDGPTPTPLHFTLKEVQLPWKDSDGAYETSAVLVPAVAAPKPSEAKLTETQQQALHALRAAVQKGGEPVTDQAWRDAFYDLRPDKKPDTNKKAFARARDDLTAAGVISADGETFQPKRDTGT